MTLSVTERYLVAYITLIRKYFRLLCNPLGDSEYINPYIPTQNPEED